MTKFHLNWHARHLQEHHHNLGGRLADSIAQGMGSWKFIIIQSVFVALWMGLNLTALFFHWDEYPFILLNLLFSTQAAFAAPIIMMSQNRQTARDRVQAEHDYEVNENSLKLISINNQLTQEIHNLTQQIHALTEEMHKIVTLHKQ